MAEGRLLLTAAWRERLLAVRREQTVSPEVETLLGCEAIFLYGFMGNSAHLSLDGRVVAWAEADRDPPEVVTDPEHAARLVVLGSRWLDMPELVNLLPPMPSGCVVCPYCGGQRWHDAEHPEEGVCLVCKGVGWRPEWRVKPLRCT